MECICYVLLFIEVLTPFLLFTSCVGLLAFEVQQAICDSWFAVFFYHNCLNLVSLFSCCKYKWYYTSASFWSKLSQLYLSYHSPVLPVLVFGFWSNTAVTICAWKLQSRLSKMLCGFIPTNGISYAVDFDMLSDLISWLW